MLYHRDSDPDEAFGYLDVYQFDPHADTSTRTHHVVSFALPPLRISTFPPYVQIKCAPAPTASWSTSGSSLKVFDLESDNQLVYLDIQKSQLPGLSVSAGTLCIPSSILLHPLRKHARQSRPGVYQWHLWGESTSWIDNENLSELSVFGQRAAAFEADGSGSVSLAIFDFDQRRVRAQAAWGTESSGEVCTPGSQYPVSAGKSVFCTGDTRASRKYIRTSIPYGVHTGILDKIVSFDDEHCKCMRAPVISRLITKRQIYSDNLKGDVRFLAQSAYKLMSLLMQPWSETLSVYTF